MIGQIAYGKSMLFRSPTSGGGSTAPIMSFFRDSNGSQVKFSDVCLYWFILR